MAYALRPGEPRREALGRIARQTLDRLIDAIKRDVKSGAQSDVHRTVHTVHTVRKGCKELRALLRMYRSGLADTFKQEDVALRDAARELAEWRDRRVLFKTCEQLVAWRGRPADAEAVESVHARFDRHEGLLDEKAIRSDLVASRKALEACRDRIKDWQVDRPRRAVARGVRRVYVAGREALRDCHEGCDSSAFHEWRKQVKHHWCHARLLKQLNPPIVSAYAAQFERLSDLLGEEHDLTVLGVYLQKLAAEDDQGEADLKRVRKLTSRRATELQSEALELGRPLYAWPPRLVESTVSALLRH